MRLVFFRLISFDMPTAVFEQSHASGCILIKKLLQIFIHNKIRQMPIIEPRAFQCLIAYIKAERLYQMHLAPRRRGSANDISRILRNFRFYQNNIKGHISLRTHDKAQLLRCIYGLSITESFFFRLCRLSLRFCCYVCLFYIKFVYIFLFFLLFVLYLSFAQTFFQRKSILIL